MRLLLADADPLSRTSLRQALERADVAVVAEAATEAEAMTLVQAHLPDVVVMDAELNPGANLLTVRSLVARVPLARVLLLAPSVDAELALDSLQAGARGIVERGTEVQGLVRVLRAVCAGELGVSRQLASAMIEHLRSVSLRHEGTRPVKSTLTQREWEVLDLLCRQRSTSAIAQELFVTEETVRSHIQNILRKLDVGSRAEAVKMARSLRALGSGRASPPRRAAGVAWAAD